MDDLCYLNAIIFNYCHFVSNLFIHLNILKNKKNICCGKLSCYKAILKNNFTRTVMH